MRIGEAETLILLRGWEQEKRMLECTVLMGNVRCRVLGHIDNIQSDFVYISANSLDGVEFGERFFIDIPFFGASYEYREGRDASDKDLQIAIEARFDSLFRITFASGLKISINVVQIQR